MNPSQLVKKLYLVAFLGITLTGPFAFAMDPKTEEKTASVPTATLSQHEIQLRELFQIHLACIQAHKDYVAFYASIENQINNSGLSSADQSAVLEWAKAINPTMYTNIYKKWHMDREVLHLKFRSGQVSFDEAKNQFNRHLQAFENVFRTAKRQFNAKLSSFVSNENKVIWDPNPASPSHVPSPVHVLNEEVNQTLNPSQSQHDCLYN